jgi:hypothetical protein
MKKKVIIFLLSVFISTTLVYSQTNNQLSNEQKTWLSKANRYEKNGWIYLHIEGTPQERGFQHGYMLANEIKEALRVMKKVWEYQTATDWPWLVERVAKMFTTKVDPENVAEINGIVEGMEAADVSTTRDELVSYNGWKELLWTWWPTVKDSISPNTPEPIKESCSSFIATGSLTANGQIVLGHNTWDDYYIPQNNIIIDIEPMIGHRIFMQSAAGLIHSTTDFFVTDAGLVGSETTIADFFPFDPKGIPEFARVRRAMQDASSIEEWCDIMKKGNNGGYANSWLLGDIKTNEIARFEIGLKYVGYEKKKDGYFSGSNIAEDLKILRRETRTNELNIKMPNVARRVRWKQLMNEYGGKIDVETGKAFLADHFDTYMNTSSPDSRTICGHWELDSQASGTFEPFRPLGAYDGKVVDATMAKNMSFVARWGSPCGIPFDASKFLEEHPQFEWMNGLLKDRPTQPWTTFKAGETK